MNCVTHMFLLGRMAAAGAIAEVDDHNTDLFVVDKALIETAAEVYRETCPRCAART